MRPKLYCYGGHIAGICLLFYIAKAKVFTCDEHSVKGTLKCESRECCTLQFTNVIKAVITKTNQACLFGALYDIYDKLPGQKCVNVAGLCDVELSYCYTEETRPTLPPKVSSDYQSTPILGNETASSPGDENVTNVQHDDTSVVSVFMDNPATRNALNSEETTRSNTQTSFIDGVIIGVPVVAVFLVVIFVSIFLFIRHQRKRRKQSATSPFNTVVRFSNADYAQTRSYGNSHERIGLTTPVQHEVADATIYSDIQRDSSLENGGIYKAVPIEVSDYANVPCACLMEDGDHDQRNPVELDKAYDHTNKTDDNNMYDSTYQESISLVDNYDKTIPFQYREDDTYECTEV